MSEHEKPKLVVIVGPTASGKTGLAIELAKEFNGEVVSADSRQVYKRLDIGTGKVTREEMDGIVHHLIDVADVNTIYTVNDFKRDASSAIEDIIARKKLPIIAGGSFFYVDTLLGRISTPEVPPNPELRDHLGDMNIDSLYHALEEINPERAFDIGPYNKRRLIRALEIVKAIGKVPNNKEVKPTCNYNVLTIGIEISREKLRARFRERAKKWLEKGFQDEVRGLLKSGVSRDRLHEIGFEYQLILDLLDEKIDKGEFFEKFEQKNWQYAKRQLTWLKRDSSINWIKRDDLENINRLVRKLLRS